MVPTDIKVLLVTSPAWPPFRCGRQDWALWRIKQAPEEIQDGNTHCEHPERKNLPGSGNTIPQESGCLLHSGDQVPWWQQPHNQVQGHQVQALLVKKGRRHCWCRSVCGRRVDRESFEVQRVSHRIILVKPVCGYLLSVYAPQSGLSDEVKDQNFWSHVEIGTAM